GRAVVVDRRGKYVRHQATGQRLARRERQSRREYQRRLYDRKTDPHRQHDDGRGTSAASRRHVHAENGRRLLGILIRSVKIVIAGGTGFLGRPLTERLLSESHDVVVLTRGGASQTPARAVVWSPDGTAGTWAAEIDGAHAVVNLAGESIAGRRWSAAHKQHILDSRV